MSLGLEQPAGGLVVVGDDQIASQRSRVLELGDRVSSAGFVVQVVFGPISTSPGSPTRIQLHILREFLPHGTVQERGSHLPGLVR